MESTVVYESNEGICSLMLNRPKVFNALNLQLVRDLISALRKAESEPEVKRRKNGQEKVCGHLRKSGNRYSNHRTRIGQDNQNGFK